eukprot:TRINITY_DN2828_c0_g1_i1.p1 TRINITY_DN2828_c0_g1~~TRINITY_DN2828_c0_g1_i1.p1  ORF type:complete len:298 (-),score=55.63 TRINITY_DN2828_c0_g1_i1:80-973(-)
MRRPITPSEHSGVVQCMIRAVLWLPVLLIAAIIGYTYFTYAILFCIAQLMGNGWWKIGSCYLLIYHAMAAMLCVSFWRAVFESPGYVNGAQDQLLENERTDEHSSRLFCSKCNKRRPPRAHHCSMCEKCVLKMDHHCPVINNCVGWGNYKFFLLLLFWGSALSAYGALTLMTKYLMVFDMDAPFVELQVGATMIMGIGYAFALAIFFLVHLRLVLMNQTTLEDIGAQSHYATACGDCPVWDPQTRPKLPSGDFANIYDLGAEENFRSVFGRNPWTWAVPVRTVAGDGWEFPTIAQSV